MQNYLILVNKNDKITGFEEKSRCHSLKGFLHRAFSIFIFNKRGELLFQQRSRYKPLWPLFWSNSCCSHPRKGEQILATAKRRLQEELGFTTNLKHIYKFYYRAEYKKIGSENEICYVLLGNYDGQVKSNPQEVNDYRWIKIAELKKDILNNPEKYTPWFKKEIKQLEKLGKLN